MEGVLQEVGTLIVGGGIAGLAAAHDLVRRGYTGKVHVVERNPIVGGQARSSYLPGTRIPNEYCWRIYGRNYQSLRRIMREIPFGQHTVYENLVNIEKAIVPQTAEESHIEMSSAPAGVALQYIPFALKQGGAGKVLNGLARAYTSSKQRLESELEHTTWYDYFDNLPERTGQYMRGALGPILGVDIYRAGFLSVFSLVRPTPNTPGSAPAGVGYSVMNGPTNERLFDPWIVHLREHGVTIDTSTSVIAVQLDPNDRTRLVSVQCRTSTGREYTIRAQHFVLALPIEVLAPLFREAYAQYHWSLPKQMATWSTLVDMSKEIMVGVQLYFDRRIEFENEALTVIYMPETPWQLVIEPTSLWCNAARDGPFEWSERDARIRDSWSIGLCDPRLPGIIFHKPWPQCSREEICQDVWAQIVASRGLVKRIPVLKTVTPIVSDLWYSYQPNAGGTLDSWEPKFSPNAGTWPLRPELESPDLRNAYIAAAYTRGSWRMILMDAAAEAGIRAAERIVVVSRNGNAAPLELQPGALERPPAEVLLAPLLRMDAQRFAHRQPHLADELFHGSASSLLLLYFTSLLLAMILFVYLVVRWRRRSRHRHLRTSP